jgi:ATP-binding cassette subfamily G (WHITE) protein 2 (SNQ2)
MSEEMAAAFLASLLGQANCDAMGDYRSHYVRNPERKDAYRQSVMMEHASTAPKSNPYIISIPMQVRDLELSWFAACRSSRETRAL